MHAKNHMQSQTSAKITEVSLLQIAGLQVVQLREQLRSRGLSADGTKAVLVERLKGSYAAEDTILNSDANASKESLGA